GRGGAIDAAAWHIRGVPGPRGGERARAPVTEPGLQQRLERRGRRRRGLAERATELRGVDGAAARLTIERRDVIDASGDDLVGHRPHATGGKLEIYRSQSCTR